MCPDGFLCNGYAVVLCMMLCLFSRIMKNVISSLFGAGCLGVKRIAIAIALGGAAGVLPAQEQAEPAQKPWQLQCVTLIRKGDDESLARAVELVRKEAEAGDATAQTVLGLRYIVGAGVEKKDAKAAAKWFRMAADRFDIGGLYEMGMLYYSGKGVKKDRKEALRFLSIAGESFGPLCLEIDRFRKPTKASGYAEECIEQMSRANADALSILYLLRSLKK